MENTTAKSEVLKGGEFLIKEADPESIFIPEDLSEEQRMMADAAKEFVTKEIWPKLDAIDKQEAGLTVSLMEKAGELGLLGAAIPEEYGGLGEDFNSNTAISMEIGKEPFIRRFLCSPYRNRNTADTLLRNGGTEEKISSETRQR